MRLHMKFLAGLLLLAAIALVGGSYNQHQANAAVFSCKNNQCPNNSTCTGDHFQRDGCKITCYVDQGSTGEITYSGDASCGTAPGGGGGGGGGGGFGCGNEGGSCWSDFDCGGGGTCDWASGTCQGDAFAIELGGCW